MGTLGRATRNGKKPAARRVAQPKAIGSAAAKLAVALKEHRQSLEQQAATAEILQSISQSPGNAQPVFEAIIENAHRLCGAAYTVLYRYDGETLSIVASEGLNAKAMRSLRRAYPQPPRRDKIVGRAVLESKIFHTSDVGKDPRFPAAIASLPRRAVVSVPLIRGGKVLGVISCGRAEAKPFTKKEIWLLKTFADQAVIAIENARLFNETKESLERQTATAEILKVIASSPTDAQPVFNVIVESAVRLCGARFGRVYRYDGSAIHMVASSGLSARGLDTVQRVFPRPAAQDTIVGQVILGRRPRFIHDIQRDKTVPPLSRQMIEALETRSQVTVPMLRAGGPIGAITMGWEEPDGFKDKQVALLQTFATQAVIAIENVRLFNETKEALERQTATADILRVISRSQTDLQPAVDAIVESAKRLCGADRGGMYRIVDGQLTVAHTPPADAMEEVRKNYPRPLDATSLIGRSIVERRVIYVPDFEDPAAEQGLRVFTKFFRSQLTVPMFRGGEPVGALGVMFTSPSRLSEAQIELVKTFADQAVIAIENVRLFNETKEALEQQTASTEVLGVISSSPTDLKPVFDAILASAMRLCDGHLGLLNLWNGKTYRTVAQRGAKGDFAKWLFERGDVTPASFATPMRMIREKRPVYFDDLRGAEAYLKGSPGAIRFVEDGGARTYLAVPLLREGDVIGAIVIYRPEVRPFTGKQIALVETFASQAVIAMENVRLFNETKEALERQTATADILKVISSSPTDVQPVFDAIVESAARLFGRSARIRLVDADQLVLRAGRDRPGETTAPYPSLPLNRDSIGGRIVLDRTALQIADTESAGTPAFNVERGQATNYRSIAGAPLMRDGAAMGLIVVSAAQPGALSDKQMSLLATFADQAVIAIENVRLFNETKEALEQQTATSEILGVISSSPTDLGPVFDAILKSATQLCEAHLGLLNLYDGEHYRTVAQRGASEEFAKYVFERGPYKPEGGLAQATAERRLVHVPDLRDAPAYLARGPNSVKFVELGGARTYLAVPLVKDGKVIGAILIYRPEVRPFSEKQIALVSMFANQAVIAIENVRLFNELQTRNRALTEALEQQTATGEILKTISSSMSDVQPVFDTIIRNAVRLCDGAFGGLFTYDGKMMDIRADYNFSPEARAEFRRVFPQPPSADNPTARAILERTAINMPDALDSTYSDAVKSRARATGYRSGLAVPMMRGDVPIGAITVTRREPGAFGETYVSLLKSFAAQAVIAVENVRLFNEINEALRLQTSTADVLKTISRSTFDLDAVLQALLDNATRLSGAERAMMLRPDAIGNYVPAVTFGFERDSPLLARVRERPIRPGRDSINGRVLLEKRPIHVPDVLADPEYGRQDLVELGSYRTVLSVPMLRDGEAIGLISLNKGPEVDPFTGKQMELVTTFADQAVIAIENVRLFKEIEEKSAQLEVANKHKSDFLANMSHELRTPLNAVIGFSEALMERMFGELNEKQADYLKDIHESGKHLLSLINDILDLSKIEAGRMELDLSSFHLPTAISNAMTLIRERAQRHGVALGLDVDSRLGEFQADERKVKQIMLNLLSNAVKFTPEGGRVEVSAKLDTDHVEIAVTDTGVGISPDDQTSLFEEFRQVGKDATRKAEGTGLGLALTKRFVELHGGAIRVDSAQGKGSTFTFSLPVRP